MRKFTWILAVFTIFLINNAFADEDPSVEQGAQAYDWQTCVDAKRNDCVSACNSSEDIDCTNSCDEVANDKCKSLGISQPQ